MSKRRCAYCDETAVRFSLGVGHCKKHYFGSTKGLKKIRYLNDYEREKIERDMMKMAKKTKKKRGFDYAVKTCKSIFNTLCFDFGISKGDDLIIVCKNNGGGHEPFMCLLPHQLYKAEITELLKKETDIKQITVFPVNSKEGIDLLKEWR